MPLLPPVVVALLVAVPVVVPLCVAVPLVVVVLLACVDEPPLDVVVLLLPEGLLLEQCTRTMPASAATGDMHTNQVRFIREASAAHDSRGTASTGARPQGTPAKAETAARQVRSGTGRRMAGTDDEAVARRRTSRRSCTRGRRR